MLYPSHEISGFRLLQAFFLPRFFLWKTSDHARVQYRNTKIPQDHPIQHALWVLWYFPHKYERLCILFMRQDTSVNHACRLNHVYCGKSHRLQETHETKSWTFVSIRESEWIYGSDYIQIPWGRQTQIIEESTVKRVCFELCVTYLVTLMLICGMMLFFIAGRSQKTYKKCRFLLYSKISAWTDSKKNNGNQSQSEYFINP